jgi:hypothetical protein
MQTFLAITVCAILTRLVLRLRSGRMGRGQFAVWFVIWTGGLVVDLFHNYTATLANALGVGRGVDLVIYSSLAFIFYFLLRVSLSLERLDRDITKLVRARALEEVGQQRAAQPGQRAS